MALFRSQKDIDFVLRINQELIEKVVGDKITYYSISDQYTNKNIYGESKDKVFDPPVEIYCYIDWQDQDISLNQFGQDIVYNLSILILKKHLDDINMTLREGDMIEYNAKLFEIKKIQTPKQIFGKSFRDMGFQVTCQTVRENNFSVSISGTIDQPLRTRPDSDLTGSFKYSDVTFPYSGSI